MSKKYTFVICAFNEKANLLELIPSIYSIFNGNDFNTLVIDDGSNDGSLELLNAFKKQYGGFDFISYALNAGKSHALMRAFKVIDTSYVITLDGDSQDNLEDVPKLFELLNKYDFVVTWRSKRSANLFTKTIPSLLVNFLFRQIFKIPIHDFNCSLKAFKFNNKLRSIYFEKGLHRFLPHILINQLHYSYTETSVTQKSRTKGVEKYNSVFGRMVSFVFWCYVLKVKKHNLSEPVIVKSGFLKRHIV